MQNSVECFDTRNGNAGFFGQFDRGTKIRFDLHRASRDVILPHDALGRRGLRHFVDCLLLEIGCEFATVRRREGEQFIDYVVYQVPNANLLEQLGVVCCLEYHTRRVECNRTRDLSVNDWRPCPQGCLPNDPLVLLLANILRNLAVNLARCQCHGKRLSHVLLNRRRDVIILAGRSNPNFSRSLVLEFALAKLRKLSVGNQRQDNIGRESFFDSGFHTECMGRVDQDACVLGSNNSIDDGSEVVDVGKGLDA